MIKHNRQTTNLQTKFSEPIYKTQTKTMRTMSVNNVRNGPAWTAARLWGAIRRDPLRRRRPYGPVRRSPMRQNGHARH